MLRAIGNSVVDSCKITLFGQAERTVTNEDGVTYKVVVLSRKKFEELGVINFNERIKQIEEVVAKVRRSRSFATTSE